MKNLIIALMLVAVVSFGLYAITRPAATPVQPELIVQPLPESAPTPIPAPTPKPTPAPTKRSATITTHSGDLLLTFENGIAKLTGELFRSTPCVAWNSTASATKDSPPSQVTFAFTRTGTGEMCIQVLGAPYEVHLASPAGIATNYTLTINEETIWSGKLK